MATENSMQHRQPKNLNFILVKETKINIFNLFQFFLGSALVPQHIGSRIVFLLLFVWAMIVYQFYTSSIVSSLLSTPPKTIRTLADLVHSSFEIGFENVLTSKDTLNVSTN